MLVAAFFSWWYGAGWRGVAESGMKRMEQVQQMFSAGILLRTIFSPWRRIVTVPGSGIDAQLRAFGDNLVSRAVGFTVRIFVLFTAVIMLVLIGLLSVIELIIWPLLPFIAAALFIRGII
jgi:hypothetical protein